jgi:magnesium transporter
MPVSHRESDARVNEGKRHVPATVTVRWIAAAHRVGTFEEIAPARAAGEALWVDVFEPDEQTLHGLQKLFGLHPLAVEDCLHSQQRPKVDAYPGNLFIVWIAPRLTAEHVMFGDEIDVFLGKGFVITSHSVAISALDDVANDTCVGPAEAPEWTLHAILDRSVDTMFPVVDMVGDELDRIENELLAKVQDGQLQDLYAAKRVLLALQKIIGPERDVLRAMARHEEFISKEAYLYFQDVGDHVSRVADAIDTYRDVASSVMDIYLSAISNRLNVVMKQLTVVATIFMPLTLISGIYGMNLVNGMWPPPAEAWSFWAVMGSFVVITGGMLYLFKRRGWW